MCGKYLNAKDYLANKHITSQSLLRLLGRSLMKVGWVAGWLGGWFLLRLKISRADQYLMTEELGLIALS